MSVATSTALIIGAGVAAGTSVAAAKMGSNAAHDAANTQVNASNQARTYQQQATQQAQQLIQQGQAGIQRAPTYTAPGVIAGSARSALSKAMGLGAMPGGQPASQTPYQPQQTSSAGGQFGYVAPPAGSGGSSGLVQMRAPNGQMASVPSDQVPHYQTLGAQVVTNGS